MLNQLLTSLRARIIETKSKPKIDNPLTKTTGAFVTNISLLISKDKFTQKGTKEYYH
jgi:hypothetical protein